MIKIAIIGFGRMGMGILAECLKEKLPVVAVVDSPDSPLIGKDAGVAASGEPLNVLVSSSSDLGKTLDKAKPDVAIDFTSPSACVKNSGIITEKGINMVIGTTGLSEKEVAQIRDAARKNNTGVVLSPNMSIGVNVFWKIVEKAAELLPDYDIEIVEKHHRFKKDAPSGTALKTAQVIEDALKRSLETDAVYGRKGLCERKKNEIGIHAIRAGDIVGEHTVLFGTLGERVEITHVAHSRGTLTKGAVTAAKYVHGKKGFYGMSDVLGLK
ncbi:MAG: 4-hydroxy-tetrahydrodipicolinate reductase [Candidatus Altiarchaeia archaeon]